MSIVEYNFPLVERTENVEFLEFSFEACAEAPGYRNEWPSDIGVSVNGVEVGVCDVPEISAGIAAVSTRNGGPNPIPSTAC